MTKATSEDVYEFLENNPSTIDEIMDELQMSRQEVRDSLTVLFNEKKIDGTPQWEYEHINHPD